MTYPLEGIRVLDLTRLLPGPYGTMLLADLGAEVIKVEEPGRGDYIRGINPGMFASVNRNKKSITLNLKREEAREVFLRLSEEAEVLVEGFRPGVMQRLGLGYEPVRERNPKIIYCAISGFGQTGPYRDIPGHDINYVAMTGALGLTEEPRTFPIPIADLAAGTFAALSILAAIIEQQRNGLGQFLDVSATEAVLSWMGPRLAQFSASKEKNVKKAFRRGGYGVFACRDGLYITIGALEDVFWQNLCRAVGKDEWALDDNYKSAAKRAERKDEIEKNLKDIFLKKDRKEWLEVLSREDVPVAPVHGPEGVFEEDQFRQRKAFDEGHNILFPVIFSGFGRRPAGKIPGLGEHTSELLQEAGYSLEDIQRFDEMGLI
jgi:CoA:oxalate CoA-transferase